MKQPPAAPQSASKQPMLPGVDTAEASDAEQFLRDLDEPLGHGLDLSTLPQIHRRVVQRYTGQHETLRRIAEAVDVLRAAGRL